MHQTGFCLVEFNYDNLPIGTTGSRNQNRDDYCEFTVTKHGYSWSYPRRYVPAPSQCQTTAMTTPCFLLKEDLPKNFQPPRNYGKWKTKMWILLTNGDNYLYKEYSGSNALKKQDPSCSFCV